MYYLSEVAKCTEVVQSEEHLEFNGNNGCEHLGGEGLCSQQSIHSLSQFFLSCCIEIIVAEI